jgi:hypothetical protein
VSLPLKWVGGTAMPQEKRIRPRARAAICAVLGALLIVAGGISAVRAADDDDDALPDVKLMRRFLHALGLQNGMESDNNYRERPPLVVPPTRDLPPPVATDALIQHNPAWPTDPDVKKASEKKKAKLEQRRLNAPGPTPAIPNPNVTVSEDGRTLMPSELQAGKTDKPPTATPYNANAAMGIGSDPVPPSELGFTANMWKGLIGIRNTITKEPETAQFTREPPRASLTDPPVGYRTPSAAQPYGTNLSKLKPKAVVGDRLTVGTQENPNGQ